MKFKTRWTLDDNSKGHLSSIATMITDKEKLQTQFKENWNKTKKGPRKIWKFSTGRGGRGIRSMQKDTYKKQSRQEEEDSSLPPLSFLARQIGKCRGERTKKGWKEINRKRDE